MTDKLLSEMSPEEQKKTFKERTATSKKRAEEGSNLTATQPNIEEQKKLDEAGQDWNNQIAAATPPPKSSIPEPIVVQRARAGGEAHRQMTEAYGGRLQTIPKPQSETPPITNPAGTAKPEGLLARLKKFVSF